MIHVDFEQSCVPNRRWRWQTVSHLTCDPTDDLQTLHQFAAGIGLKRCWFQPRGGIMPHYDLTPGKRWQAIQAGAHELKTRKEVVLLMRRWKALKELNEAVDRFLLV
jgi:hypothetical protein